jgi:predicted XRE-type DNA-binding protein
MDKAIAEWEAREKRRNPLSEPPEPHPLEEEAYWARRAIFDQISCERDRQTERWGDQSHLPDGTGPNFTPRGTRLMMHELAGIQREANNDYPDKITFQEILLEEVWEALAETNPERLWAELTQVAAVVVQWLEVIERRPVTVEQVAEALHVSPQRVRERVAEGSVELTVGGLMAYRSRIVNEMARLVADEDWGD